MGMPCLFVRGEFMEVKGGGEVKGGTIALG